MSKKQTITAVSVFWNRTLITLPSSQEFSKKVIDRSNVPSTAMQIVLARTPHPPDALRASKRRGRLSISSVIERRPSRASATGGLFSQRVPSSWQRYMPRLTAQRSSSTGNADADTDEDGARRELLWETDDGQVFDRRVRDAGGCRSEIAADGQSARAV